MLLFVRLTLTPLFWLREIQRGRTWRSVTRWEGSLITSTSSTTWWELHCNRDEGTMRLIVFYVVFFAERLCKENWCESTSAMWQSRLWLKGQFKTRIMARWLMSKVTLQFGTASFVTHNVTTTLLTVNIPFQSCWKVLSFKINTCTEFSRHKCELTHVVVCYHFFSWCLSNRSIQTLFSVQSTQLWCCNGLEFQELEWCCWKTGPQHCTLPIWQLGQM